MAAAKAIVSRTVAKGINMLLCSTYLFKKKEEEISYLYKGIKRESERERVRE